MKWHQREGLHMTAVEQSVRSYYYYYYYYYYYCYYYAEQSTRASGMPSAIDVKVFAGDERCGTGGQESDRLRHFICVTNASQRMSSLMILNELCVLLIGHACTMCKDPPG